MTNMYLEPMLYILRHLIFEPNNDKLFQEIKKLWDEL